ncbi:hypothetical protein [Lactococcus lactis]|uniref:Uncharacterized protein n=2 Tax=Lactococcus lactis TaxID=1358 RepID=A0AAW8UD43_9LACT|nr:hypothetical protein [Lactococcus lactis]MDT2882028.1 hypothetical protein [Lactococcus lactis]MDT2946814.1 hypothetical protein [Lactococcus lactis]
MPFKFCLNCHLKMKQEKRKCTQCGSTKFASYTPHGKKELKKKISIKIESIGEMVDFEIKGGSSLDYLNLLSQGIEGICDQEGWNTSEIYSALYHSVLKN